MTLIAVIGSKGGVGKTTTLALIAEELILRGLSIHLADSDRQGSLKQYTKNSKGRLPVAELVNVNDFEELAQREELVFLDTPGGLSEELDAALWHADAALLPISPSGLDTHGFQRAQRKIKHWNSIRREEDKPRLRVKVIPTLINRRRPASRALLEMTASLKTSTNTWLTDRSAFERACDTGGLSGLPYSTRRLALREVEALVDELEKFLGVMEEVKG